VKEIALGDGKWAEAILRQVRSARPYDDRDTAALLGLQTELRAGVDLDVCVMGFLLGVQAIYGLDITLTERP
jgi:hypothetical protein